MDDYKIIALIGERSQTGMELLAAKYSSYARKIAHGFFSNSQDAEECVNDAFLDVWNMQDASGIKNLKAFVVTCVRRRATDMLRSASAQKRSKNMTVILSELEEVCSSDSAETTFENNELGREIDRFIKSLNQPDKDIFLLRYFYGTEIKEIARRMHLSRSAVDNRLLRCRKKLKERLEEFL